MERRGHWLVGPVIALLVVFVAGADAHAGNAADDSTVLREIDDCLAGYVDFEVFMKVDAPSTQVKAARAAVLRAPDVEITKVVSKRDAYKEFRRIFADSPKLVNSVTAADLPVSIRARVQQERLAPGTLARLGRLSGVDAVEKQGAELCTLVTQLHEAGRAPSEIATVLRDHGLA